MKKLLLAALLAVLAVAALALWAVGRRHRQAAADPPGPAPIALDWTPLDVVEAAYDGKLGSGWSDWGWGPHELPSAGPAKIVFGGFGGLILRHDLLTAPFGMLSFRYRAPADWPEFLQVSLKSSLKDDTGFPEISVDAQHQAARADGWREVRLDFAELNPGRAPFERIVLAARTSVASDWVQVDKVVLTKPRSDAAAPPPPTRSVELAISCGAATHAISPLIYGSALGAWESGQTAQRIGGNPTTRFNWELGTWNAGNDWFFENGKAIDLNGHIDEAVRHGAGTALTVPMIGWVAKDATSVGFPAKESVKQRKYDPNRPDVGDGFRPDGKPLAPGPPSLTSVAAPPELIGKWVRALREHDATRGQRGVQMYILDNEPSLWDTTHRDVHPEPLGYDELLDRTLRYAAEIRKADPEARIAGPAEWGWLGYLYSGRDRAAGKVARPDRRAHGDVPLIPWYLQRIAEHEKATGVRLLDVLDVHFYPAADKVYGSGARVDPAGAALRLRSTRALWDPDYLDESWINEPIRLIPRLREWVAANHPGLAISLGEWSFGADGDISGGLATAEALGRFGQQGLDAAFYWDGPKVDTPTFWAFRAYRNFDGHGGHFLEQSLSTRETAGVSLFASRDAANTRLVAILINRDPTFASAARISLDGCARPDGYRVFGYQSGSKALVAGRAEALEDSAVRATLPPYSVTVLDITLEPSKPLEP